MKAYQVPRLPTAFSVDSTKGRKRPRKNNGGHLKFIRGLRCCSCGTSANIEAAHVRYGDPRYGKRSAGIGEKPDDRWTVPLCNNCHVRGVDSQHNTGEKKFWTRLKIDPLALALALWGISGDDEAGEQIVGEHRRLAGRA